MKTLAASLSILTQQGVMLYLLRGVAFTCRFLKINFQKLKQRKI